MDLLTPWKMCLQCLPVFSSDPAPPPSKALPLHSTSAESQMGASAFTMNSSENDFQEGEKPSFSDASLTHDHQHQDLPLSDYAKEVGSLAYAPADTNPVVTDDAKHADHDTNKAVFTNTVQAPHGFEFTTTALPSPITPPIGLGYIVGQHMPLHHIHHQVNSQHKKGHSFFHSHSHHDKAPPLHPISDSIPNDQAHPHPPLSSSQSASDGGKVEAHHHTHQHSHKQNDDTLDDGFPHPPPITSHVHGHHMTTLPLETSHSTPADIELVSGPHGLYKDEDTAINGSSSALVTSQSEPIDGVGTERVRRRDQLKHQFKDLRSQLKQGGHHLKEEGSKHLQNMMSTMNKQSQQIEESRSFFMVPRNQMS